MMENSHRVWSDVSRLTEQVETGVFIEYEESLPERFFEADDEAELVFGKMEEASAIEQLDHICLQDAGEQLCSIGYIQAVDIPQDVLPASCGLSVMEAKRLLAEQGFVTNDMQSGTLQELIDALEQDCRILCFVNSAALSGQTEPRYSFGADCLVDIRGIDLRPEKQQVCMHRLDYGGETNLYALSTFMQAWSAGNKRCLVVYQE